MLRGKLSAQCPCQSAVWRGLGTHKLYPCIMSCTLSTSKALINHPKVIVTERQLLFWKSSDREQGLLKGHRWTSFGWRLPTVCRSELSTHPVCYTGADIVSPQVEYLHRNSKSFCFRWECVLNHLFQWNMEWQRTRMRLGRKYPPRGWPLMFHFSTWNAQTRDISSENQNIVLKRSIRLWMEKVLGFIHWIDENWAIASVSDNVPKHSCCKVMDLALRN